MAKRFLAILFMILFVFSVSAVNVFAEDIDAEDNAEEIVDTPDDGAEIVDDGNAAAANENENDDISGNDVDETPTEPEEPADTDTNKSIWSYILIPGIIVVVIVVIAILIWRNAKLREKIKKFIRDYRSEMKKIVWPTRSQVIQNTGVVLIAIVFIAALVGLLDLAFGTGAINLLGKLRDVINSSPK